MLYENLKEYFVDDLIFEDTEVIFVLESPHTQEVRDGYPVAGKSGVDMSQVLLHQDEAFGKLIFTQKVKKIGILNVSNYPLQHSAYTHLFKDIEFFPKIRQNPKQRKYDKLGINTSVIKIMQNFQQRLALHKDKTIVLCGNFAQEAFATKFQEEDFKKILKVPHPSFNNWKKERYKESIEILKQELL
jgi:uracil-DNA glycosylase